MSTTYTEAKYSTSSAAQMIREWLRDPNPSDERIDQIARYMSQTLRIGGMKACRALVKRAIEQEAQ